MFFLWADRLSNANSVTRMHNRSLPSRPSGKNMRRLHLGAASLWLHLTNTHTLPPSSNIHSSSAKHTPFICVTCRNTLGYTFSLSSFFNHFLLHTHVQTHAHTHSAGNHISGEKRAGAGAELRRVGGKLVQSWKSRVVDGGRRRDWGRWEEARLMENTNRERRSVIFEDSGKRERCKKRERPKKRFRYCE